MVFPRVLQDCSCCQSKCSRGVVLVFRSSRLPVLSRQVIARVIKASVPVVLSSVP